MISVEFVEMVKWILQRRAILVGMWDVVEIQHVMLTVFDVLIRRLIIHIGVLIRDDEEIGH